MGLRRIQQRPWPMSDGRDRAGKTSPENVRLRLNTGTELKSEYHFSGKSILKDKKI